MSDMNVSMAGLDESTGDIVFKKGNNSMMSGDDSIVQVKTVGGSGNDSMADLSMAGLSEQESVDVVVGRGAKDDSMAADFSMASLGDSSMAGIDDSGYRPPASKGGMSEISESSDTSNLLDGLKKEFAQEAAEMKTQQVEDNYRMSTVYDEKDEDEYSEDEDDDGKLVKRRSFRKSRPNASPKAHAKLGDLAKR